MRATAVKREHKIWKLLQWGAAILVVVTIATGIAYFGTVRSEEAYKAHLHEASLPELRKLERERDYDPTVFYELGVKLTEEEGNHVEAVRALSRSVGLNPNSANAHAALGLALARAGNPIDAEAQLKAAIALNPKLAISYFTLGNIYYKYGRWVQAQQALQQASTLRPEDLETKYLLALCYGEIYQDDKKLELLEQVSHAAPDNPRYLKSLGICYLFFGRFPNAEECFRKILRLDPGDLEAHYLLGRALAEQANTPEAFATAEQELRPVAEKLPNNPQPLLALGILYFRRNDQRQAISYFERAINKGITEHKTWLYLGQAYERAGRAADAQKALAEFQNRAEYRRSTSQLENRLVNIPDDSGSRLRLAKLYMSKKDYHHATGHLEILMTQKVPNTEVPRMLAECRLHETKSGEQGSGLTPGSVR